MFAPTAVVPTTSTAPALTDPDHPQVHSCPALGSANNNANNSAAQTTAWTTAAATTAGTVAAAAVAGTAGTAAAADHLHIHPCTTISHPPLIILF
jgi:hypothetical protein